ncbi:hypothetical protein C8A00DRAFT_42055 [Chaetomidium leptoderma]|uniref:Retrovirus-related Pol polyprotein from transposon TNT 1-94-like beta-barrel domain-containing protein n=1 Tax=Chaetomidium leptoderma TaxID=669021 RepID=A0AAN6VQ40_9PEZI|nr:hypothetical protein C8A00DRAFT_42055 [Chaetomidium leptoderma]
MATPSETPGLCPDWVLASGSNVHVARDRAWFSTYTPFPTFTTSYIMTRGQEALGIGDVHLPVKLFPKRSGPGAHGTPHLRNVLHVPTAICNIVGNPGTGDYYDMVLGGLGDDGKDAAITAEDGRRLGYFVSRDLWVLKLSGPPIGPVVGPSMFEPGGHYVINATWPDSERQRWAAAQAGRLGLDHGTNREVSDGGKGKDKAEAAPSAPYQEEEKGWLKREWGGEFKFLTAHGLSIYKEEDRDEGRRMARAMMEVDEDGDTNM